jgi:hypothetical protein
MKKLKQPDNPTFEIINVDGSKADNATITLERNGTLHLTDAESKEFMEIVRDKYGNYTINILKPLITMGRPSPECLSYWVKGGS